VGIAPARGSLTKPHHRQFRSHRELPLTRTRRLPQHTVYLSPSSYESLISSQGPEPRRVAHIVHRPSALEHVAPFQENFHSWSIVLVSMCPHFYNIGINSKKALAQKNERKIPWNTRGVPLQSHSWQTHTWMVPAVYISPSCILVSQRATTRGSTSQLTTFPFLLNWFKCFSLCLTLVKAFSHFIFRATLHRSTGID